jgi:PhzF family phenazine biosynthesis protein
MVPFHLVDAFTDVPFAGNPAGVVLADGPVEAGWAQRLAAEVRASETAVVHPDGDRFHLRWWTPETEVDLCGHATLATAHALWSSGASDHDVLRFDTRSGELSASRDGDRIALDLPAWPVEAHPEPDAVGALLGPTDGRYLGRTAGSADQANDVIELGSEAQVRALEPDRAALLGLGSAGLIVTAAADPELGDDLVSRYFAPAVGIDEDPVTGSAHCTLGPLWAERLGRQELSARQVSPRGGRLWLTVDGDRVAVAGHAVTVIRGQVEAAPDRTASATS